MAPWWVGILNAAEAWGVPAYDLAGEPDNQIVWLYRFLAYREEINKYSQEIIKER